MGQLFQAYISECCAALAVCLLQATHWQVQGPSQDDVTRNQAEFHDGAMRGALHPSPGELMELQQLRQQHQATGQEMPRLRQLLDKSTRLLLPKDNPRSNMMQSTIVTRAPELVQRFEGVSCTHALR